jgi:hypothetical protein
MLMLLEIKIKKGASSNKPLAPFELLPYWAI